MKTKLCSLACPPTIFILLALFACRVFIPSPEPTSTPANNNYAGKTTETIAPTHSPTTSPTPEAALAPTALPASLTSTAGSTSIHTPTPIPLDAQLNLFGELWLIVNDTYVYPDFNGLDWNAINQEINQKISDGLTNDQFYLELSELITRLGDNHSFFLDPQQVAEQETQYQGKRDYVGIGVMVSAVPTRQRAVILAVFSGSEAQAVGLQPRDSILSVDGTSVLDENGFVRDIVRGPEGTSITMTVQTPGELPRDLHLSRLRVTGDYPLLHRVLTTADGKRIGYILLVTFEDGTVDEQVASAIREMSAEAPLEGIILDNRMNNGGSSLVLEPMLGYFAGGDLGYYINQGQQRPLHIIQNDVNGSSELPLAVLVGSGTASYGEIFAGILQDIGRAYLIGTTTDGNVEILWGYDLEDGSQLWLASETFRPLNHLDQDWEKSGIIPDLPVSADFDEYTLENDPAVLAALGYLAAR